MAATAERSLLPSRPQPGAVAMQQTAPDIRQIHDRIQRESAFVDELLEQAGRVIVGQRTMIERLLIGLITGGHVLLEGVPGLAKTLTVKTLADCLQLTFKRIQFTPDLLPADLVGTQIYQPQRLVDLRSDQVGRQ